MQNSFCEPCRAELIRGNICPHMLPSNIIKKNHQAPSKLFHLEFILFSSLPLASYRPLQIQFDTTEVQEFQSTSSLRGSDAAQKGLNVPRNVDLPPPALLSSDTLHCNPRSGRSSHFFYSTAMLEVAISPAVKTIRVEENAALSRSMAGFVAFI